MATFVLIHGGGGSAWDWHLLVPDLVSRGHDVVVPELPIGDRSAGFTEFRETVVRAIGDRSDLVIVGHSYGGFTAPLVAADLPVRLLVLLTPMIPTPGEAPGDWWGNTGHRAPEGLSEEEQFHNGVPPEIVAEAAAHGRDQVSAEWDEPWPLDAWPDVPTKVLIARDDRFFPADFQRRVAADRLGVDPDEIDGGHSVALSHPTPLADRLTGYLSPGGAALDLERTLSGRLRHRSMSIRNEERIPMERRTLGRVGEVSALTLGGGGLGQVWGPTTREEATATVREAVDAGIDLIDVAPGYGDGEAERVVGEAFGGRLPAGVRVSTKCGLGNPSPEDVATILEKSLDDSLARMRLSFADVFFLHNYLVTRAEPGAEWATPADLFVDAVRPALEDLVRRGRIGAWGITAIAEPDAIVQAFGETPAPAVAQCVTNLLDSPGELVPPDHRPRPRDIVSAARRHGVGVMGIRAVQAGALTDALDRDLPPEHPTMVDFRRAEPFRLLARELGESPGALAHRYAFSMPGVDTVVLGVKNRAELRECVAAAAAGTLSPDLVTAVENTVRGGR